MAAPLTFQVVIDAASPRAIGAWWADALGYVEQPPPPGFDTWEAALEAAGMDPEVMEDMAFAIVDPTGSGPRVFFQKVPEAKTVRNRIHLDLHVGPSGMEAASRSHTEPGSPCSTPRATSSASTDHSTSASVVQN